MNKSEIRKESVILVLIDSFDSWSRENLFLMTWLLG